MILFPPAQFTQAPPDLPMSPLQALASAPKALLEARDWAKLEGWAREAMAKDAKDPTAPFLLGLALAQTRRLEEAVEPLRAATRLLPNWSEAWFNLGLVGAGLSKAPLVIEALDGLATCSYEGTLRLLERPDVSKLLNADEPSHNTDFSGIIVRLQPPAPRWPPEARAARIQGMVKVEVTIDDTGRVIQSRAVEGPQELQRTAASYAACWRFAPAPPERRGGRTTFILPMPFRLK